MRQILYTEKLKFTLYIILNVLLAALTAYSPFVTKNIVDLGINGELNKLLLQLVIAFLIILLTLIVEYFRKLISCKLTVSWIYKLKQNLFNGIMNRSFKQFKSVNSAEYTSALTHELKIVEREYFNSILTLYLIITQFIVFSYAAFKLNKIIASVVIAMSFLPLIVPKLTGKMLANKRQKYTTEMKNYTIKTEDYLGGFEVIKANNLVSIVSKRFQKVNKLVADKEYSFTKHKSFLNIFTGCLTYLHHYSTIAVSAILLVKAQISPGTFIAFVSISETLTFPVSDISYTLLNLKSMKKVNERLNKLMKTEDLKSSTVLNEFNDKITIKDLSFAYDSKPILKGINLTLDKGKKYAIVGESGSGKSTLIKLLLGYYDSYNGEILYDSNSMSDLDSISNITAHISQNVFLFDDTLKNNIGLYHEYSNEQLSKAISQAGLQAKLNSLPLGLNSFVGENGNLLSGGEKQRVAIARALIKGLPVMVLDEATSSLDNETAFTIERNILNLDEVTAIVITHKLEQFLLEKYDEIIVIKDGRIIEQGPFDYLMSNKKYFFNLYTLSSQ